MGTMTERGAALWERTWFPSVPLERVALFRIAVTTFALVDVAFVSNYMWQYATTDARFYHPTKLLEWTSLSPPSTGVYAAVYAVLIISLIASIAGYRTRYALAVAGTLYLYHWSLFNSWGKVNHGKIPVVIALLVLAIAPAGYRFSVDALQGRGLPKFLSEAELRRIAGWALRMVGVVIVLAYTISVIAKLQDSGIGWPLRPIVETRLAMSDRALDTFLVANSWIITLGQTITFVAEALAFLAFFGGWRRNLVLLTLGSFHIGAYVLMETEFFGFLICYLVFFELERISEWLPGRLALDRVRVAR